MSPTPSLGTVCAVLMAGGAGTRLWPESRKNRPKPFLPLLPDGRSTLAAAFDRLDGLVERENRFVVAGKSFENLVRSTLPKLATNRLLLEPVGRDTAPCVAWAALEAIKIDPNATLVVLPSDAWIAPDALFRETIERAVQLVDVDPTRLVTLGIVPNVPSSAYGYIEIGAKIDASVRDRDAVPNEADAFCAAFNVASFCEKPNVETARAYLETGRYFWNAGIFVWKARRILELIRRFEPELSATFERIAALLNAEPRSAALIENADFIREFSNAKRISVDYAVLERAPNVVVLEAPFFWDDLGSFSALERIAAPAPQKDDATKAENVVEKDKKTNENLVGGAELIAENAAGNFVRVLSTSLETAPDFSFDSASNASKTRRKLVALVDVDDLLIVETDDALLVAKKGNDAALRRLTERLKNDGRDAYL